MRHNRYKLLVLAALALSADASSQSLGPSELNATGASTSISGIVHEYAIGSVVATPAFSSANLVITPGVLQPDQPTGIDKVPIAMDALRVFPSPMETVVHLDPAFNGGGSIGLRLLDASGKLVLSRNVKLSAGTERQSLDVSALAAGNYFLHVSWIATGETEQQSSFKLQKLK